jgi:prepilin-type N-terminal cleavage/methylation domain-containing protein
MHGERGSFGFTVIEILVAVTLIGVGLLAVASSSALVLRMLADGRRTTIAIQQAERRLEDLRRQARMTAPRCLALAPGSAAGPGGMDERWEVIPGPGATVLRVVVSWPTRRGVRADTLATAVACA